MSFFSHTNTQRSRSTVHFPPLDEYSHNYSFKHSPTALLFSCECNTSCHIRKAEPVKYPILWPGSAFDSNIIVPQGIRQKQAHLVSSHETTRAGKTQLCTHPLKENKKALTRRVVRHQIADKSGWGPLVGSPAAALSAGRGSRTAVHQTLPRLERTGYPLPWAHWGQIPRSPWGDGGHLRTESRRSPAGTRTLGLNDEPWVVCISTPGTREYILPPSRGLYL